MHQVDFSKILRSQPEIHQFKIIQETLDQITIYVVSKVDLHKDFLESVEQTFKSKLGQAVNVTIQQVSNIPTEKSGKFRYVVSKIANKVNF